MKLTREFYIPKGATKVAAKDTDAIVYIKRGEPFFQVMAFAGKRQKPDYHYRFSTEAKAQEWVAWFFEDRRKTLEYKAQAKAEAAERRKATRERVKVGDIFYTSWGYDQTNVFFYQVVARTAAMVTVQRIGKDLAASEKGCDYVIPNDLVKVGDTFKRMLGGRGFTCENGYSATAWEGVPVYETAWGYGH